MSAVINVRGRGRRGGWVRRVAGPSEVRADSVLRCFMNGDGVSHLAAAFGISVYQVEQVLRWFLKRPAVMREILGGDR